MSSQTSPLCIAYLSRLASGDWKPDPAQKASIDILADFSGRLKNRKSAAQPRTGALWGKLDRFLFGGNQGETPEHSSGLYIYGKVGRGKSMLMDLFMEHAEIAKKRRVHFHQFMLEIHARLYQLRRQNDDIMESLVKSIAAETSLLCFDEFHVSNIADAMILGRLFEGLFNTGVAIVSTSNSAPDDLYKNGLQRDRFLPFIDLIKQKMQVVEMDGKTDYRYEQLRNLKSYFTPLGLETTRKLQGIFFELTHDAQPELVTLLVDGRELRMSRAAQGIGFFNFDELCQTALGAADYLAIAQCLHTVILDGVPLLKAEQRNEAVRFMTLIDALYEAKVKLFMASAAPIEKLTLAADIAPAFQRTISRLMEMQGEAYRLKPHLHEGG